MHGNNLGTLHQYLHEDILPAELGGSGKSISCRNTKILVIIYPTDFKFSQNEFQNQH